MTTYHWPIALILGVAFTMLQFLVVGILNQTPPADRDEFASPAASPPLIIAEPPERIKAIPKTETEPRAAQPEPLAAAARLQPSALSKLDVSQTQLALGSILPNLGEASMGAIDVVELPSEPDRQAQLRRTVEPIYPVAAQRKGIEGYVLLRFSVDPTGKVTDVMVVDSEPIGVFERSAREAARRFEFVPARSGGAAVPTTLEQKILFTLQ